jgi:hypothetical protein
VLFGLIMALTFTLGAHLLTPAEVRPREMVVAMLGCNVAWGIIDGALYLIGSVFSRNQRVQFVRKLRHMKDEDEAFEAVREEFGLEDEPPLSPEDRAAFHRVVLDIMRHASLERAHLRPQDWMAALLIAILVTLTAVPGVLPFLALDDSYLALRLANCLQIALLFYVGFHWARHTGSHPWRAGLMIVALCVGLVVVSVALGG